MNRLFLIIILLIGFQVIGSTQSIKKLMADVETAFQKKDYPTALANCISLLKVDSTNLVGLEKAGQTALELKMYKLALYYLEKLKQLDTADKIPYKEVHLARIEHHQGNYDKAISLYRKALSNNYGLSEEKQNEINRRIEACRESQSVSWQDTSARVKLLSGINSIHSDFAMPVYQNLLYHITMVKSDIINDCDCESLKKEELQLYKLNLEGNIRDSLQNPDKMGHVTFNARGDAMYFTKCEKKDGRYICSIYYKKQQYGSEQWGESILVEGSPKGEYTSTHPHIALNPEDNKEYLYFASDRPGGKGGLDIWKAELNESGQCQNTLNIDTVNTAGDEVTPFFHTSSNSLFFSTNGRATLGEADFDIYEFSYSDRFDTCAYYSPPTYPHLLGMPLNSSFDDLYFSKNEAGTKAYFSSNREGSLYDSCYCHHCSDIFEATIKSDRPKNDVEVHAIACCIDEGVEVCDNELNYGSSVNEAKLELKGNSSQPMPGYSETRPGIYLFEDVPVFSNLQVEVSREGYKSGISASFSPSVCPGETTIIRTYLRPEITLKIYLEDISASTAITDIEPILVLNQSDTIKAPPIGSDNSYTFEITGSKDYKIVFDAEALKEKYCGLQPDADSSKYSVITVCEPDTIYRRFSFKAPGVGKPLYFDHDIPLVESYDRPLQSYEYYFGAYLQMKPDFLALPSNSEKKVNDFFKKNQANFGALSDLFCYLKKTLSYGDIARIHIDGFASSHGRSNNYPNTSLSERRIKSVEKYITEAMKDTGIQVEVIQNKMGDTRSAPLGDAHKYSIEASNQRRIEISYLELVRNNSGTN